MSTTTARDVRNAWDGIAPGFDQYVTPYTTSFSEEILASLDIRPGDRFLEIASGTGAMSLPAARLGAQVLATDLSPAMVERLGRRARAAGLDNLEAKVMDGTSLELEANTVDVAASQNGVSLFADLKGGLREMVRVVVPGGKVLVAAFGRMDRAEFVTFFMRALKGAVPGFEGFPPDEPPLAFQLADPDRMRQCLEDAGLEQVTVHTRPWHTEFSSADQLLNMVMHSNPLPRMLIADLNDEELERVRSNLTKGLAQRSGNGSSAVLTTEMNVGLGSKPLA